MAGVAGTLLLVAVAAVMPDYTLALAADCIFTSTRLAVDYLPSPYSGAPNAPQPRISDLPAPRLSWQFLAQGSNKSQSGYRIQVASSPARLQSGVADVWDSGLVSSNSSLSIPYGGALRPPRSQSFWRVQVWDEGGATCGPPSDSSAWGVWETPLLLEQDWSGAQWVTRDPAPAAPPSDCDLYQPDPAPLFRRDVALDAKPPGVTLSSARAYIVGLGYFELYINGAALPEAGALDPAFTSFNRTVLYSTQNATAAIGGAAAFTVGVALGKGWWDPLPLRFWGHLNWRNALAIGPPLFRLALYLDFSDGSTQVVTSSAAPGSGWLVGPSELLRNNIYLGTVVNRSLEQPPAWLQPGFTPDATWATPHAATTVPSGVLRSAYMPPVRRFPAVPAVQVSSAPIGPLGPGQTLVFDVGRQMSGVCRWCTRGGGATAPGALLRLRYGEVLYANGSLNGLTSVAGQIKGPGAGGPCAPDIAWQEDVYTARGDGGGECYQPAFEWHAFRFIEVTGSGVLSLDSLECSPMRTDLALTTSFNSSSSLLNSIWAMDINTAKCNMMSIQSDCPHRERLGYGGDALMSYESLALNFDTSLFHEKRVRDYGDDQRPDGGLTETAPYVGMSDAGMSPSGGPIGWQSFFATGLEFGLRYHGNVGAVRDMYSKAGAFITLLRATPVSRIENGLGDWMGIEDSALGLTGWAFAYQCYSAFAALAEAVGDTPAAAAARADAASTMATINAKFLDEQGTPGLYRCSKAANCTSAQFNNTQCGQALPLYFGLVPPQLAPSTLALLVENLAAHGNHLQVGSFALKYLLMALGDAGRPDLSYAIMSHTDYPSFGYMLGMNATTAWESWFYSADTFSHNHPMFTSGSTYLFQSLAGMRAAPGAFGVDRLELVPRPPPPTSGLTFVQASWETVRGRVASAWSYLNSTALNLTFSIPPNVQALLTLPLSQRTIPLGSGEYSFVDSAA